MIKPKKFGHLHLFYHFTVPLKLFSQAVHNTRYDFILQQLLSWKRLWMSDLVVLNICIQTQKQLATLNNFWALLKSVLIDLRARNFVHAKTSLRARSSPCAQFVEPWAHSITLLSRCPTHSFQKQKQLKRKNEFPSLLYFPAQMSVLINQSPRLSFKVFPTLNSKQLWNTSSMVYKRNFFLAKFTIAMIT